MITLNEFLTFSTQFYGDLLPLGKTTSKARVRTFYKGLNRNKSFINDFVAQELIDSAPGAPVIGFYDKQLGDFTSHLTPDATRSYGFISESPNFAWEKHLDEDGVEREYACFDVVLWTTRYEEAKLIISKPQSMELNPTTVSGLYKASEDGRAYFEFTKAQLIGFCILGSSVEPCFEGAAFYSKGNVTPEFINCLFNIKEEIKQNFAMAEEVEQPPPVVEESKKEEKTLPPKFNTQNVEAYTKLWNNINTRFNTENEFMVDFVVCGMTETSALVYKLEDSKFYSVDLEGQGEPSPVLIHQYTQEELVQFQQDMQSSEITENLSEALKKMKVTWADVHVSLSTYEQRNAELETTVTALTEQVEQLTQQATEYQNLQKEQVIDEFAGQIDEVAVREIRKDMGNFSLDELRTKLALAFTQKHFKPQSRELEVPLDFEVNPPNSDDPVIQIVEKYKKKVNKE